MSSSVYLGDDVGSFDDISKKEADGRNIPNLQPKNTYENTYETPKIGNLANLCSNVKKVKDNLKTKLNYKIYNLMLPILILFLIIFFVLIWIKGNNTIKMSELNDNMIDANDSLKKAFDEYKILYDDSSKPTDIVKNALDILNLKQKEFNDIKASYNATIYTDNYCDKLSDLCNGIIGAILMVYIGSAGYKMIKHNKEINNCEVKSNSIMNIIKSKYKAFNK